MHQKKYLKVISFLTQKNRYLEIALTKERKRRAEEFSKVIKSLLCFEAKLKHDRKMINQQLCNKDTELCRLARVNRLLRQKLAAFIEEEDTAEEEELLLLQQEALNKCASCRKENYGLEAADVWTQTFDSDNGSLKDEHNTEYVSSSDETPSSSFCSARRSVRYTSKRTLGTFQDYMRSRSMSIDDLKYQFDANAGNLNRDKKQPGGCYEEMNALSSKIDRMHGIRKADSFDADSSSEPRSLGRLGNGNGCDDFDPYGEEVFLPRPTDKKSGNKTKSKQGSSKEQQEFETSTDDWYASASDQDDESVLVKPYGYNAVNPVLECVNQILLQQSMDELINPGAASSNSSGRSSSKETPSATRKRVHFSTKNSMLHAPRNDSHSPQPDNEPNGGSINYESIYSNEYEPIGSDQNSSNLYVDMESKLGQEDILLTVRPKRPPALPPKPANLIKFKRAIKFVPNRQQSSAQTIILKETDTKSECTESEPDYCSISELNGIVTHSKIVVDVHKSADETSVISTADSCDADLSQINDHEVEEILTDIPMLPNVAAIVTPKFTPKKTKKPTEKTRLKLPVNGREDFSELSQTQNLLPNVLAELNRKIQLTPTNATKSAGSFSAHFAPSAAVSPSKASNIKQQSTTQLPTEDKSPLQAEFDWYNLDVEYWKSTNRPDVVRQTNVTNLECHLRDGKGTDPVDLSLSDSVEYNLDEEFSLANQPDIIKENILENGGKILVAAASSVPTICGGFPTIVDQSPGSPRTKNDFKEFLDGSGLTSKPLPRQRKIYFSGPFV